MVKIIGNTQLKQVSGLAEGASRSLAITTQKYADAIDKQDRMTVLSVMHAQLQLATDAALNLLRLEAQR